jgi:RNA polymerase sigma factor (sigma-70 family)
VPVEDFDTPDGTVDRFYRRFAGELRVFFKRRSRRHSPEDLVHIVFLHLLNCQELSQIRDPQLYIYKTAWHVLYTENRRLKYEAPLPGKTDPEESEESLTAHSRLWDEETVDELVDLERALEEFRPEQRIAFLLHWDEGYTCEEVSARTKLNIHTVRKYVGQVMLHLRKRYSSNALYDR